MVQRNRQTILICAPQFLKHELGLRARVHKNQRHVRGFNRFINFRHSEPAGMP